MQECDPCAQGTYRSMSLCTLNRNSAHTHRSGAEEAKQHLLEEGV